MMTIKNIIFIITIIFVITAFIMFGCGVSTKNFPKPDSLKEEICKSINVPFVSHLLIYSPRGLLSCASQEELNRFYSPHLYEQHLDILQKRFKGDILFDTGDDLYMQIDKLCAKKLDSVSLQNCLAKDKIIGLSIKGEAIDNNTLRLSESYRYNGEFQLVEKLFTFNDDKWTFTIISKVKDASNEKNR